MAGDFRIVGELDLGETAQNIKSQLEKLSAMLKADGNARVKLVGGLDLSKTQELIKSQLATISNNNSNDFKVKVGADVRGVSEQIQNEIKTLQQNISVSPINKTLKNIKLNVATEEINKLSEKLKELGFSNKFIEDTKKRIEDLSLDVLKINSEYTNLTNDKQRLTTLQVKGIDDYGQSVTYTEKYSAKTGELLRTVTKVNDEIARSNKKVTQTVSEQEKEIQKATVAFGGNAKALKEAKQYYSDLNQNAKITGKWIKDQDGKMTGFTVSVKKANGEIENFNYSLSKLDGKRVFALDSSNGLDAGVLQQLQKAETATTRLQNKFESLNSSYTDSNSNKFISNTDNVSKLEAQYIKVEEAINRVKNADANTLQSMINSAESEINNLKILASTLKNAEYAANQLRTKTVEESKQLQENALQKFMTEIANSKVPMDLFIGRIDELKAKLGSIKDANSLTDFLVNFEIAKSNFNTLKQSIGGVEDKLKDLSEYSNLPIFTRNSNNAEVQTTKANLQSLINKYIELKTQLSQTTDTSKIADLNSQIAALQPSFSAAIESAKKLETLLKESNGADKLAQKTKILISQINAYAAANQKAMKSNKTLQFSGNTVAQEISNMLSVLESGNATAEEIDRITRNLRILKNEVKSLGISGNTMFGSFWQNIKKFGSWMGMTNIVSRVVREATGLFKTVVNIDTAMTSLKKVTDATDSQFERFLKNASKNAKELGSSITDIIDSTAEFARLGFNLSQAEELGRVATLYKNVGDGITATEASESIISTMKAFNIEAKDAESIIDKFNQVGNNFSISSAGIGEALKRSASALAAANNDLSQSIALQVGANNVIQDPDVVGNMWKTVSMRIRGAKSELEEAGLETEGMVETTAEMRDIIKSMTGFDIMVDDKTFKSTYDIIVGIGKEWKNLTDIEQSSLLEKLAGKRQGNALSAALTNIKDIEDAYKSAENAAGSAQKEQERYMQSTQYSIDVFKATLEDLAINAIDSSFMKGLVEDGIKLLNVIKEAEPTLKVIFNTVGGILDIATNLVSKIGLIPSIMAGLSLKGTGKLILNMPSYASLQLCA